MAKEPHQKTNAELAQDLSTRPDSLVHLTARAEMARRAAVQDQWRSWIMLASVVIAALAAAASACSAYFAYLSSLHKWETQKAPAPAQKRPGGALIRSPSLLGAP
jgi:hypothetical protein